jgi:hypothetical protein
VHRLVFRFPEMDEQPAPIVVVVLGPPGAGKGTQSSLLANLLGVPHISIGGPPEIVCTGRMRRRSAPERHDGLGKPGARHFSA